MSNNTDERMEISAFSRTFEKMCNFIAVAKTGNPQATIRGLITICIFEFPDDKINSAEQFQTTIHTLFGLSVPEEQIELALSELITQNIITQPGNTNYRLEPSAMEALKQAIDETQSLEDRVKATWFNQLKISHPELSPNDGWKILRAYLQRTFRRHGIQAAALLDPAVQTPAEQEVSLTTILRQVVEEHGFLDDTLKSNTINAISEFMAALDNDIDRIKYITQLADAAFNFYTLEIPTELSEHLRQHLHELTLFLDTNFLFGILDLHHNTQVTVSCNLLQAINRYKLPFKLRFHSETKKEMYTTICYYGDILRSRDWSTSLSRAASTSCNLSGIEQKFHERNAKYKIDVEEFLRPYEHFDSFLAEKNIKIFRPDIQRPESQNDLFHEYKDFLDNNRRGDKPYETIMHDAKVLEEVRYRRTNSESSLEAGALLITCDYFLYRFDWKTSRKTSHHACVLLPNIFWQILRPFIPADQDFEKAFAETFSLPEFRAIGNGGAKACTKMLQILATYKDVPEQTAMKMLANDLLLDRLRTELNDIKFAEQVEAAFIEENKNLLEEKSALAQELQNQKLRALEHEKAQKDAEQRAQEAERLTWEAKKEAEEEKQNRVTLERELERQKLCVNEHRKAMESAEQRAQEAERLASEAHGDKKQAKGEAFLMRILAGIAFSIIAVGGCIIPAHIFSWDFLLSHKNSIPLQISISAIIISIIMWIFVRELRTWSFWGIIISLLICLLQLSGN